MVNLCANAAYAMKDKGGILEVILENVTITKESMLQLPGLSSGSFLKLTVRDTGTGIEASVRERIFEPYYTTKEKGVGTGLGLAAVHGIIQSYGGKIDVHSKMGEGTTFHIYFPRIDREEIETKVIQVPLSKGNAKILFVDDEITLTNVGKYMLERLGYHVTIKTSSPEALELFQSNPDKFDLLITDQTMPQITGEELAREIMQIRPGFPVILCTGFSERIDEAQAKAIGIREFIMKPIDIQKLSLIVQSVLKKKLPPSVTV